MFIPEHVEQDSRRMYIFLFALMFAVFFGWQAWQMMLTNFAVEGADLNGFQMGTVQAVRELPGLLSFLAVYLLLFIKEYRVANFAVMVLGFGMLLVGWFPTFGGILATSFIVSVGFHFYETMSQSMVLQYFSYQTAPLVLGKLRGLAAMASVIVAVVIIAATSVMSYKGVYMLIGAVVICLGALCLFMKPARNDLPLQSRKISLKKEYWLYYVMTVLSGSRRQIFVVFGLYLLVKKFGFSVTEVTLLFLVNNLINFFLNPIIGKAVNRFGERRVATFEYTSVVVVFAIYAFTNTPWIAALAYIYDQFTINLMIAERTFFQKISAKEDIVSGTATGFALNHIAAVTIPVICGYLWLINYRIAFFAGIVLALINLGFIQLMDKELKKGYERKAMNPVR